MPLVKGNSLKDCISKNYKIEVKAGKSKKQAQAIALNHCNKIYGGAEKKDEKKEASSELELIRIKIDEEIQKLYDMSEIVYALKKVLDFVK